MSDRTKFVVVSISKVQQLNRVISTDCQATIAGIVQTENNHKIILRKTYTVNNNNNIKNMYSADSITSND